jgi:hypothetical protein
MWKKHINYVQNPPVFGTFCDMCIKLQQEELTGVIQSNEIHNLKERLGGHNCKAVRHKVNEEFAYF